MNRRRGGFEEGTGPHVTALEADRAIAEAATGRVGHGALVTRTIASLPPFSPPPTRRNLERRLSNDSQGILPLEANECALGPSERALEAARDALSSAHQFPDAGAHRLRAALGVRHGVPPERVLVGSGITEVVDLLVRTFVGPSETVVCPWPSYVLYRLVAQAAGREVLLAPLRNSRVDLSALAALVDARTKLVFIANPNNPTGTYVPRRELAAFLDRIPRSVIVALDEAYAEYVDAPDVPDGVLDFAHRQRLVVMRTFSKAFGLAGLRVGYAVTDPELVSYMERVRPPFSVNAPALAAARAALADRDHLERVQRAHQHSKRQLVDHLSRLPVKVPNSQTNFLMVRLDRPAAPVVEKLQEAGILVRDLGGYGLANALRVTVGRPADNVRFVEELAGIVSRG